MLGGGPGAGFVSAAAGRVEGFRENLNKLHLASDLRFNFLCLFALWDGADDSTKGLEAFIDTVDIVVEALLFGVAEAVAVALGDAEGQREVRLDIEEDISLQGDALLQGADAQRRVGAVVGDRPLDVVGGVPQPPQIVGVDSDLRLQCRLVGCLVVWLAVCCQLDYQQCEHHYQQ